MKKFIGTLLLGLTVTTLCLEARALNLNLLNVNLGSPEAQQAQQLYGNAYGFSPQQVAPAMLGPAQETPAILRIAQAAGTVPMTVWMMRKMGMSYSHILQNFALAPSLLGGSSPLGSPLGGLMPTPSLPSPGWGSFMNPFYVETARTSFLRNYLQVDPVNLVRIPYSGRDFTTTLIQPNHPVYGAWMPPGIAKKYGLWMPPGQAKKYDWDRPGFGPVPYKDKHWKKAEWRGEDEDHDHDRDHDHDHDHWHHEHGHEHHDWDWHHEKDEKHHEHGGGHGKHD